jgi:hypothetical protein
MAVQCISDRGDCDGVSDLSSINATKPGTRKECDEGSPHRTCRKLPRLPKIDSLRQGGPQSAVLRVQRPSLDTVQHLADLEQWRSRLLDPCAQESGRPLGTLIYHFAPGTIEAAMLSLRHSHQWKGLLASALPRLQIAGDLDSGVVPEVSPLVSSLLRKEVTCWRRPPQVSCGAAGNARMGAMAGCPLKL